MTKLEYRMMCVTNALENERQMTDRLKRIIWAIVKKCGGEVRLLDAERNVIGDNWQLEEYTHPVTAEYVIQAKTPPTP